MSNVSCNACFSLTVSTVLNVSEVTIIKDVYGNDHPLTRRNVNIMLGVGWACFVLSWLINIAYYKFHPSSVEVISLSDKKILHVLGREYSWIETNKQSLVEGKKVFWGKKSKLTFFITDGDTQELKTLTNDQENVREPSTEEPTSENDTKVAEITRLKDEVQKRIEALTKEKSDADKKNEALTKNIEALTKEKSDADKKNEALTKNIEALTKDKSDEALTKKIEEMIEEKEDAKTSRDDS